MKLGLALSGGGVKGAGHVGVIKALKENGIGVDAIGGTSIGSIVSALYAMDYTTDEMLKLFKYFAKYVMRVDPKYYWANVKSKNHVLGYGLVSSKNIEDAMEECANIKGIKNITDIKMPIAIPTVDIVSNKEYVFTNNEHNWDKEKYISDVTIGKAVRASSSYPGMFSPTIIKDYKFVDGGLLDNLPANEVRKLGVDKVLSVRFNSKNETDPKNAIEVVMKSVDLMFDQRTEKEMESSDYTITLDLSDVNVFNVKKIDYCYNQGYKTALENMDKIKKMLNENIL